MRNAFLELRYKTLVDYQGSFKETIEVLNDIMDTIDYGFVDKNNKITSNDNAVYIQSPENCLANQVGMCFDQVHIQKPILSLIGPTTNYYIDYTDEDGDVISHAFSVLEYKDNYYWYEHSWYNERGLHKYDSLTDLINSVIKKHCPPKYRKYCNVCVFPEKYDTSVNELFNYLQGNKLINRDGNYGVD